MLRFALVFGAMAASFCASALTADDWMFNKGPYTADPKTGQRVEQYAQPKEADRVPYDKFFTEEHPYIPYWYYYDQLGWPGEAGTVDVPYGSFTPAGPGGLGFGGFQF